MDLDRILSSDFTSHNKTKKLYHSNRDNDINSRDVSSIDIKSSSGSHHLDYSYNHNNNIDGNSDKNSIVANDNRAGDDYADRSSSDVAVKSSVSIHHLMDEFHHLMEEIEGNSSNSTAGSYNGPNYTNSHDDSSGRSSSSSSSSSSRDGDSGDGDSGDHNYIINNSPQTNAYHYNDNYHHADNEDHDNNINTGNVLFTRSVNNNINNNHHHYSIGSNNDMDRDNQFDVDDYNNNYPRDSSHDRYHDSGDGDDYAYHTVDDDANMKDDNNDGDDDNDDDMMDETNIFYPSPHSSDINGNNYDDGREEEQKLFNDFYQVGYDVHEYSAAEHDDYHHGNDDRYYRHRYDDDHGGGYNDNVDDKYDGGRYDGKDDVKHESSSSDDSPSLFAELKDEESIASVDSLHNGIEDIQHDDHDDDGRYHHNRRHHHIDYNHYHNDDDHHYHNDDDHLDRRDDGYVNTDESNRESSSTAINRNVSWTDTSIVESSKDTFKAVSSKDKNYRHVTFDSNVQDRSRPAMYNKDYNRRHHHGHQNDDHRRDDHHHHDHCRDDARATILVDGMNDREGVDERSNNDRKSFEDNGSDEIGTDPSIRKMPLTSAELKDEVMKLRRVNASLTNAITAEKTTRQQLERRIDTMTVRRCYHCHNLYNHFHQSLLCYYHLSSPSSSLQSPS